MEASEALIKFFRKRWLHAFVCGGVWAFAFPRFEIAGFAWLAPGYLFLITRDCESGESFRLGYLTGLTAHLLSLHWLLYIPVKFAPVVGWLALCAYLAIYPAVWAVLMSLSHKKLFKKSDGGLYAIFLPLIAAACWTALEMVRARLLTGFPWNLLGVSQYRMIFLIQIADLTGVYGISFLIVWFSCAGAIAFYRLVHIKVDLNFLIRPPMKWLTPIYLPILSLAPLIYYNTIVVMSKIDPDILSPFRTDLKAVLIQPSIPQTMIWDENENEKRFKYLIEMTKSALTNKPDLVVLPEAAIPGLFRYHAETYRTITEIARENKVWMIIGADDAEAIDGNTNRIAFYNSSFLISPDGFIVGQYSKQHLVMFGEYVPLSRWLPFLKYLTPIGNDAFTPGRGPQRFKFHVFRESDRHQIETSVIICFEDVIPHLVRKHVDENLDFLVNLTNDGWFGESAAQWQHLANAMFRAVENRRTLVRCTNNGISCCVNEIGQIFNVNYHDSQKDYKPGVKVCDLLIPSRELWKTTFYTRHGDVFGWSCIGVSLVVFLFLSRDRLRDLHKRENF